MADQDGPAWELLPDLKTVRMTLPTTPPTGLELDAESLDALLAERRTGDYCCRGCRAKRRGSRRRVQGRWAEWSATSFELS